MKTTTMHNNNNVRHISGTFFLILAIVPQAFTKRNETGAWSRANNWEWAELGPHRNIWAQSGCSFF